MFNITHKEVPDMAGLGLDSGSMSIAFPGLYIYGNDAPMRMGCYVGLDQGPLTSILTEGAVEVVGNLSCDQEVLNPNTTNWDKAVTIYFGIDARMTMGIGEGKAKLNVTSVTLSNMKHKNSTIGGMDNSVILEVFNMMLGFMLPMQKSIELPELPYVELNNSISVVRNGFLEVATDLEISKILVDKILHP